jgi:cardiolipin synthase
MTIKNWKKEIWSIPNILSMFRLILIPVYILIYLNATGPEHYYIAAGILAVSCLTDLIDGKVARHFNMVTTVGKILDPIADKATQFSLIICIAIKHPILWTLMTLFIIKEGLQLIAGIINFRRGHMLTRALLPGKICTTILFISLILLVLMPNLSEPIIRTITCVDLAFMLFSFANYIYAYYAYFRKKQEKNFEDL